MKSEDHIFSTDQQLREARRAGDALRVLGLRLRAGEVTREHVELAARLGHPVALVLCPETTRVDWLDRRERTKAILTAEGLLGKTLPARVASDWVENVLVVFESKCPEDLRPREVLAATRAWANSPCEELELKAQRASEAVMIPVSNLEDDYWEELEDEDEEDEDEDECDALANETARLEDRAEIRDRWRREPISVVRACEVLFRTCLSLSSPPHWRPAIAARVPADADLASAAAASAADLASAARPFARQAECGWQRLRLAAYLLGEV